MRVHAFILHLPRATARHDNAQRLLQGCGVPGEIWLAVDGAALTEGEAAAAHATGVFAPRYPFALRTGELGCALSHRAIWAEMQRRDIDAALIVEDDAALDHPRCDTALELATSHLPALGFIQLQTRPHRGPADLVERRDGAGLCLPRVPGLRTTAQILTPAAARRLLEAAPAFDRPVDTLIQSHWHTGLRPGAIYPSGVRDIAATLDGSTIQGGRETLPENLWREWARFFYRQRVAHHARRSRAPWPGGQA